MKKITFLTVMLLAVSSFGQSSGSASAIYASNGKLVGLTNLSALSTCPVSSVDGKVKSVTIDGNSVGFLLKKKHETTSVVASLEGLAPADWAAGMRDLIRKGNPLRVGGYTCESEGIVTAFSIDRIY